MNIRCFLDRTRPVLLTGALILALACLAGAPVALAQEAEQGETDVDAKLGIETENFKLELNTGEEEKTESDANAAAPAPASSSDPGGPWYANPVLAAVIGVGLLVVVVLAVMAARNGTGHAVNAGP